MTRAIGSGEYAQSRALMAWIGEKALSEWATGGGEREVGC
jgi:hypothetical protein